MHYEVAKNNTQLRMMKEVTCYQPNFSNAFTVIQELNKLIMIIK